MELITEIKSPSGRTYKITCNPANFSLYIGGIEFVLDPTPYCSKNVMKKIKHGKISFQVEPSTYFPYFGNIPPDFLEKLAIQRDKCKLGRNKKIYLYKL
jgi:hypothetical protein